ncbi:MAG: glycosyltransferase [Halarcobacter ebronensis]|uniref:glycosyltransferase n=1 Tax=Halarcobacter ebronensis TaxID=1462615 RepID=UPI003C795BA4
MIKVLFIVAPAMADKDDKRGVNGPERRSANIINYWKDYDIEPVYAYPTFGTLHELFSSSGYKMIDFYVKGKFDFASVFTLLKIIKENDIDVVHTQGPGSLDMMAALACKIANIKLVFTRPVMLDDLKVSKIKKVIFNLFDKLTVGLSQRIIAVSTDGEKRLKDRYKNSQDKIVKVFNGIDLSKYNSLEKKDSNHFNISMCAQLTVNKGWFDFIDICEKLKTKIPNLKVYIIGYGPLYRDIEKIIVDKNLEDVVIMTGHTNNVYEYLSQTNLYVMTSYREGLSVAVIEALASSLPLVIYDFAGSDDQVAIGQNGYIVKNGDINYMVEKILDIYNDKMKLDEMGKKSRVICEENFTENVMVENYVKIYKEVLNEK